MIDLSILILTLNSKSYLRDCLNSIREFPPATSYEIWIADNGSNDGTVEMLEAQYPEVRIIRNTSNLGFTKPTNQLLNAASGDFLLLLNPDTLLTEDCFTPQLDFLKETRGLGSAFQRC